MGVCRIFIPLCYTLDLFILKPPSGSCGEVYYVLQGLRAFTTSWVLLLDWLKSGIKKSLEINPSQDVTLFSDDIKKAQEVLCIACRTASATWLPLLPEYDLDDYKMYT